MANHASHGSLPYPVKGARYTVNVPYLDADGDPTDPTTPDTEISKDGGDFADCAEEVTTIVGGNGVGMLTISGAEMDCSIAALAAKAASGPKNTLMTLKPRLLAAIFSGTAQAGAAGSLTLATDVPAVADLLIGCILKTTGGTGGGGTGGANNQARVITDFTTGRVASVAPNWETTPDGTTTYEVLLTEASILRFADIRLLDAAAGGVAFWERSARCGVRFTVGSGSTTTSIVTSSMDPAAGVADQFKGRVVIFDKDTTTANLRGQGTKISASTSGGVLTVDALTTAAVSGDTGVIV